MPKPKSFRAKVYDNIRDEQDDERTYRQQAKSKNITKGDKKVLLELARDEADHKRKLKIIQRRLQKK